MYISCACMVASRSVDRVVTIMVLCSCKSIMGRGDAVSVLERGFWREWKFYVICMHYLLLINLGS